MYSEILNILYEYSTKRKFVDEHYIRTIINIVTKYKNTKDFVGRVNITQNNSFNNEVAEYSPFTKDITVFMDNVSSTLIQPNIYDGFFDSILNQKYFYHNLLVTQKILKQLEFAYQKKLLKINSNTIETRILRPCFNDTLNNEKKMTAIEYYREYRKYLTKTKNKENSEYTNETTKEDVSQLSPSERIATITSYGDICLILDRIKNSYNQLSNFYFASLEEAKFYGYEVGLSPTEKYFSKLDNKSQSIWKSLGFYNEDRDKMLKSVSKRNNFVKRILLGLPISIDEYLYTANNITSSEKYAYEKRLK